MTETEIGQGLEQLSQFDYFAFVLEHYGEPPLWQRATGFATLLHIILEQQVSLASAKAAFKRLEQTIAVEPAPFLMLDDAALKQIGFSRQKTRYGRILATALLEDELNLEGLELLNDAEARAELTKLKGIGRWTADIYLLMALGRPNIWPKGDIALASAYQYLRGLTEKPSQDDLESIAENWQPYRSLAAKLLWHYYLSR
ncbi:MAG: DNA-3-methyladenine glycosylase 2 family protein [Trueperaceae bacterium]|nr:DNA-3-methyladenine glycosylase 2 family protein [Trueperaceae bacterium]